MTDPGLLYILLGLVILSLIITGMTLAVGWIIHLDMRKMGAPTGLEGWCETCRLRVPNLAEHLGSRHMRFDDGSARAAGVLLGLTAALVAVGCALYATGLVGWAQLLWVLASGSAGAGVMAWLDRD